ncbi:glycogenin glucosyltransferase [Marasmius crinis-equi]|uniref:Glycogenin glucosyltransferase n=1 Tax=Marasmius crinis-equi TaxID=585013 RepID=A0ABR3EUE2_9AGAR
MASPYAFVTLVTSDFYLPGALTLAAALQDVHPSPPAAPEVAFQTVCLVTPETVDVSTVKLLRRAFNVVVGVEVIIQEDDKGLQLLGRPDLSTVLTKLHVFRLTQYSKIIFLDADVLPIRPLSHLFTLPHEFSAAPDVGWPDIFNSGVMVLSPGEEKFQELQQLLQSKGSWDGGDQGLLNEWRGNDWNRISFTYNTTPTAAYTYAPAYERFGSQISAIHFIGPNKPWKSITYRAPFQSSSKAESPQTDSPLPAYDYNSLLDRWFAVYDKYYRAQDIVPDADFEVRRYVSAWDGKSGTGADVLASSSVSPPSGTIGLEDLRRLALEGMSSIGLGPTHENAAGEGEYKSLPLEGRFDLMRLPPPPKRQGSTQTLSSDDVPPSPHPQPVPLPHTDSFRSSEHVTNDIGQSQQPGDRTRSEPSRPFSPPLLFWNPAVEPPPTIAPNSSFPSDTYFPNQWDQASSKHHQHQKHSDSANSTALFEPPPPPQIPEPLQKLGHYRNVTGLDVTHSPDPHKVKAIFPWEGQARHRPGRVFPPGEAPSPTSFASELPEQASAGPKSPEARPASTSSPSGPPSQNVPHRLTFANAWDTVPSIQRYASKLVQPPPPPQPLAAAFDSDDNWKSKSWNDRAEISSRDGDDEDNADDDDSSVIRWADSDNETDKANARSRSNSTISTSHTSKGKKKEYRVRGVQTLSREMRDQAVQVDPVDTPKVQPQSPTSRSSQEKSSNRHRKTSLSAQPGSNKKQWALPTTSTAPPVFSNIPEVVPTTAAVGRPNGTPRTPPQGRSPRVSNHDGSNAMDAARNTLKASAGSSKSQTQTESPTTTTATLESGGPSREVSNDGSSWATSPPSSIGPISPRDDVSLTSPQRKGGRVWDPARGVDLFKRGSEEVLARFLKMGSWDESPR